MTVVAEDSEGASASIEVAIAVTDEDENEPPSFDPTDNMRSVAENTEPGQAIGDPVAATDPEGNTLTYSLGGTDADAFGIDEANGQLRTSAALDYETRSSYSVTVVAEDSEGASASIEVTIAVTDEDENEPPSFDPTDNMRSVAENTEPGQAIGDPVTATDPEGNTLTYSLGGTDADAFGIDEANGQLRTSAALDYETRSSYSVTVVAEDSEGASASIEVTISVTDEDENEPPSFDPTDNMRSVAENTEPGQAIGDPVAATDPEGNTLTYSLGGTDADAFGIDEANGQLRTSAALDYETRSSYSVTVVAEDSEGASASIEVTIAVTDEDENEPPSFDPTDNMRSVAENTEPGQAIGDPVTATDPEGNTLTYSLGGTDADAFGIDEANGQLRTSAALDYETRSSYSVTVVAEDSEGASASIEVTISVTDEDENEPPSFDPTDNMRSVAENTEPGQAIGDPVAATDPEGNTLTYSLGGTDADAFGIDATNGQLRTSAALDYETRSSYSVTVVAEDSEGASDFHRGHHCGDERERAALIRHHLHHAHRGRERRPGTRHRRSGSGHGPRLGRHPDVPSGGPGCSGIRHRLDQRAAPHPGRARPRGEGELLGEDGGPGHSGRQRLHHHDRSHRRERSALIRPRRQHAQRGREHRAGADHRRPGGGHGLRLGRHPDLPPGGHGCGSVRHRIGQRAAPHQRRPRPRGEGELLGDGGGTGQ